MRKEYAILLTTLLLTIPLAAADIQQPPVTTDPLTSVKALIVSEGLKTRTELTKYFDAKITEEENKVQTIILPYIDANFKEFDDRMHQLAIKFMFQFSIAMFTAILLGNATWYTIKKWIENIGKKKNMRINKDPMIATKQSIITPEYKAKLERTDKTLIKKHVEAGEETKPPIPTMQSVEEMLNQKHAEEKEMEQREKEEEHG